MSEEDLKLIETLGPEHPAELERSLAVAMNGIGRRINSRPNIVRSLGAADQLKEGYVVASEAQAAELADLMASVIDGEKALEAATKDALRIPKAMEKALREAVAGVKDRLSKARLTGNAARVAYQSELRRLAALAEEKARQEAAEAARIAAERAAAEGDDIPPEAEIEPVAVPRTVSGGTGKMGTQIRVEAIEVVNRADVPPEWFTFDPARAKADFLAQERAGWIQRPAPGPGLIWQGVRFESRESAVNRR